MPSYVRLERVAKAIESLNDWRGSVRKQSIAHVLPLLALIQKGINKEQFRPFEESDDFAFFDKYCGIPGDAKEPYFDPFGKIFRIASHPHSNIATARKGTFSRSWQAASYETAADGTTTWRLDPNYASIFAEKLGRGGVPAPRINVVDLAVWLFREQQFPDGATATTLKDEFLAAFPFDEGDFDQLFQCINEPSESLFQPQPVSQDQLAASIRSLALPPVEKAVLGAGVENSKPSPKRELILAVDDPLLEEVRTLLALGTSGIILRGAPGTGKSWYADQIALALTESDESRIFKVQFHPSYTYEDFVDGFAPNEETKSGFSVVPKVLRLAIAKASQQDGAVVLIVDEINRGNTSKIFGETLTYIERGWRGVSFVPRLSEAKTSIPQNLVLIGTMNPFDRSITALDMAMLRRFDHVEVPPDSDRVSEFLRGAGMHEAGVPLIAAWFDELQRFLPHGLGHTFFRDVADSARLGVIWRYRIQPFCRAILEHDAARMKNLEDSYAALHSRLVEAGC